MDDVKLVLGDNYTHNRTDEVMNLRAFDLDSTAHYVHLSDQSVTGFQRTWVGTEDEFNKMWRHTP